MQVSIWEKQSFYSHKQVIIVGSGLAGLWSALELYKLDNTLKILILERGYIPTGASTRNAGFACFGSPTELLHDAATLGEDKMWQITEMRYKGLEKIKAYFSDDVINYEACGGYELLDEKFDAYGLGDKLNWLNRGLEKITGEKDVYVRNDERINQFNFKQFTISIENKLEGGLHSGKLVQALTKKALGLGIEIITGMEVNHWERNNDIIELSTRQGILFNCDKLLICSNGLTSALIKNIAITPARGQILVTSPIAGLPFTGTFHVDEGFYYFRNLGNRVLLGGARNIAFDEETTANLDITALIQNELEAFLKEKILPGQSYTIEHRWGGTMGFTQSKLPVAEQVAPGVFMLITCNGMGVALSPIMAEKAAALVLI